MNIKTLSQNLSFCVNPWAQQVIASSGKISPCIISKPFDGVLAATGTPIADLRNETKMCSLRLEMINGKQSNVCKQCHDEEHAGVVSARQRANVNAINHYEDDIDKLLLGTDSNGKVLLPPLEFILNLSSSCRLSCVMCREEESSSWVNHNLELSKVVTNRILQADFRTRPKVKTTGWTETGEFFENLKNNLYLSKKITFLGGGDPFDNPMVMTILQDLVDRRLSASIQLELQTSGEYIPELFWEVASKFKNTDLMISIDAVGKQNDYLRFPSKWENIEKNIALAAHHLPTVIITPTVSILNVLDLTRLYKWVWDQNFKSYSINFGFVSKPTFLDIRYFGQDVKKHINEQLWKFIGEHESKFPSNYFDSLKGVDSYMWQHKELNKVDVLKDYLRSLDVVRKTDAATTFPELLSIL